MKLLFHKITSILNIAGSSFTVREQTLCGSWERLTPSRHTGTQRFKTSLNPSLWRKKCAPQGLHSLDETHPKVSSICASQNAWWCTASHTHSPTLPRGQWQMTYIGLQTQNECPVDHEATYCTNGTIQTDRCLLARDRLLRGTEILKNLFWVPIWAITFCLGKT